MGGADLSNREWEMVRTSRHSIEIIPELPGIFENDHDIIGSDANLLKLIGPDVDVQIELFVSRLHLG